MEMKTSSLMRSGMPYLRMKSSTESSSCALMNSWPSMSMGSRGGAVWSFSPSVSIFWLSRIARPKLKGAWAVPAWERRAKGGFRPPGSERGAGAPPECRG